MVRSKTLVCRDELLQVYEMASKSYVMLLEDKNQEEIQSIESNRLTPRRDRNVQPVPYKPDCSSLQIPGLAMKLRETDGLGGNKFI